MIKEQKYTKYRSRYSRHLKLVLSLRACGVVFKDSVAATKKKPKPNQTQLQATGLSSCDWASLSTVAVAVGSSGSQVQPVATSCNWSQQADFTSLLNLRWYKINVTFYIIYLLLHNKCRACPSNNGLDGQGFIYLWPVCIYLHMCCACKWQCGTFVCICHHKLLAHHLSTPATTTPTPTPARAINGCEQCRPK
jgi:hypothetical protein